MLLRYFVTLTQEREGAEQSVTLRERRGGGGGVGGGGFVFYSYSTEQSVSLRERRLS